jgi:hypothetical protein
MRPAWFTMPLHWPAWVRVEMPPSRVAGRAAAMQEWRGRRHICCNIPVVNGIRCRGE